jgi:hypothetical protein
MAFATYGSRLWREVLTLPGKKIPHDGLSLKGAREKKKFH